MQLVLLVAQHTGRSIGALVDEPVQDLAAQAMFLLKQTSETNDQAERRMRDLGLI